MFFFLTETCGYAANTWQRYSFENEERPGSAKHFTISKLVKEVNDVVLRDRKVKMEEIAKTMDMCTERLHHMELDSPKQ